ncbi:MAG: aspartate aminotransferase family protein [Blastopirellula sp.]|nr:MAG: aspartate aminotransferase family protein [Blastopirellula sp.]
MSTTQDSSAGTASTGSLSSEATVDLFSQYVVPNYGRYPINLVRGEGSQVWDAEGKQYLDFFPGWGCNLLGHCPDLVVKAVQEQVAQLIHVPNSWHMQSQGQWAKMLSDRSFGGQAFFCNSGTEANEAAIKLARLHSSADRYKIITFQGGFHGRTYGATSATAQPKYHEGIGPLMAGFVYAPFGDLEAVKAAVDEQTCAIMIEPVQGEGGVRIPPEGFLQGLRAIADENNLLLIFDEVQTGCGRTGHWFGYQHFDVTPDIMTLAKSICGGIAGGALLTTAEIAPSLRPGMHAATFGGNPIAARAGIAALEMIERDNLLENVAVLSEIFKQRLTTLQEECDFIKEVRVIGMMIGLELTIDGGPFVKACMEQGLLINCTQGNVIRFLPAMNLTEAEAHQGCDILAEVMKQANNAE